MPDDWENGGFGLYIHWPFCESKCPYCDFNSHVARKIDQPRWLAAYLKELDHYAAEVPGRVLTSVFFGGGTPSLMDPESVARIIERIRQLWPAANDLEVTLEANPSSVEAGRFRAYAQGGVNRISMGIQALNDPDLKRLGRLHSVEEAYAAFEIARTQFERVSFDLIYARQSQSVDDWRQELGRAVELSIDHLSLYQLTIEQGTAFGERYKLGKLRSLPDDDDSARMYEITQELCEAADMPAYEVSNHAKIGSESRHNSVYWRYGDYVGIGPGAHGRLTLDGQRHASETWMQPDRWLTETEARGGEKSREILRQADQLVEFAMMGLRLVEGISSQRFEGLAGKSPDLDTLQHLSKIGMIFVDGDRIAATSKGRMVLNSVISELLVAV